MTSTATFAISAAPERIADYLSDARNVLVANHKGPVVERSGGPIQGGSWVVLAFDQIRVRVEYTSFDPPDRVAVQVNYSGRGSRGMSSTVVYSLEPIPSGGTRVTIEADGTGGAIARAVNLLTWPLAWRLLRDRIEERLG